MTIFMNSFAEIGCIQSVSTIAEIRNALSHIFCTAVSVKDDHAPAIRQAMAQITTADLQKLRGVTIEGNKNAGLNIRGFGCPLRSLEDPTVPKDFGLPASLIPIVMQDHLDYIEATDNDYAISTFRVGDDLTTGWHSDKGKTAENPQAHRNFSSEGMYIASANTFMSLKKESEHFSGEFFSAVEIGKYELAGDLVIRRQEMGERLYFREGFLHRSATQDYEKVPDIPHLRMLTRGPRHLCGSYFTAVPK